MSGTLNIDSDKANRKTLFLRSKKSSSPIYIASVKPKKMDNHELSSCSFDLLLQKELTYKKKRLPVHAITNDVSSNNNLVIGTDRKQSNFSLCFLTHQTAKITFNVSLFFYLDSVSAIL
jgi:hypothetical protein